MIPSAAWRYWRWMMPVTTKAIATLQRRLPMLLNGPDNPQNCPFSWDCVTPPEEDRATAIGKKHENWWRSRVRFGRYDRGQTDRHTDVLITILRHRSCGRGEVLTSVIISCHQRSNTQFNIGGKIMNNVLSVFYFSRESSSNPYSVRALSFKGYYRKPPMR